MPMENLNDMGPSVERVPDDVLHAVTNAMNADPQYNKMTPEDRVIIAKIAANDVARELPNFLARAKEKREAAKPTN